MPKEAPPASTSPLSLSRIRLYRGTGFGRLLAAGFHRGYVPHLVPRKPRNRDILAQLGDLGLDQLSDRQAVFLDERLIEQANLFVELGHAPFHDAVDHVGGLALKGRAPALDLRSEERRVGK